jgi:hypothetical protein
MIDIITHSGYRLITDATAAHFGLVRGARITDGERLLKIVRYDNKVERARMRAARAVSAPVTAK